MKKSKSKYSLILLFIYYVIDKKKKERKSVQRVSSDNMSTDKILSTAQGFHDSTLEEQP
jgi:hypothetical protein